MLLQSIFPLDTQFTTQQFNSANICLVTNDFTNGDTKAISTVANSGTKRFIYLWQGSKYLSRRKAGSLIVVSKFSDKFSMMERLQNQIIRLLVVGY